MKSGDKERDMGLDPHTHTRPQQSLNNPKAPLNKMAEWAIEKLAA